MKTCASYLSPSFKTNAEQDLFGSEAVVVVPLVSTGGAKINKKSSPQLLEEFISFNSF